MVGRRSLHCLERWMMHGERVDVGPFLQATEPGERLAMGIGEDVTGGVVDQKVQEAKQVPAEAKLPAGTLRPGLSRALWAIAIIFGFLVVPFVDVFPGGYFQPTEIAKPLFFGGMVAAGIRYGIGALCGEKWGES